MSKRSVAQLKLLTDQVIKTNNNEEITSVKDNSLRKNDYDSYLNLVDGGLVIDAETGYSTPITPNTDYSFATKKYVDDATAGIDLTDYIRLDGTSAETTGSIKIGDGYGLKWSNNVEIRANGDPLSGFMALIAGSSTGDKTSSYELTETTNDLYHQDLSVSSKESRISLDANNGVGIKTNITFNNYFGYLRTDNLTAIRTYQLPNASGTVALTSDIPAVTDKQDKPVVISANQTADNDGVYYVVASAIFTDPSPVEGKGFTVFVRNGTATVGGTAYSVEGTVIRRIFHSGAWTNYPNVPLVSGTNIKTVAGTSLLGSGDIGIIPGTYGGTGVNNSTRTMTYAGNVAYTGAFNPTFAIPLSATWTYPTPASGTASTLAGLETANAFTQVNTFSNTTGQSIYAIKVNDPSTGYQYAMRSTSTTQLLIAEGFSTVQVSGAVTTTGNLTCNANVNSNSFRSRTAVTLNISTLNSTSNSNDINISSGDVTTGAGTSGNTYITTGTSTGTRGGGLGLFTLSGSFGGGVNTLFMANMVTAPTSNPTGGFVNWSDAGNWRMRSSGGGVTTIGTVGVSMETVGQGLLIKEGANATLGSATLTAGTVTINTTKVTANSRIFVTIQSAGGTLGAVYVSARTAGTSFTITSMSALDTSVVAWFIVEPN